MALYIIISSIIGGIVLIGIACLLYFYGGLFGVKTRTLAESATLGPEWQTFTIQPPLEVQKVGQEILMQIDNVNDWVEPGGILLLGDGSQIQIEVELTDQNGKRHALVPTKVGASITFGPARTEEGAGFAKGRRFVELRLRSNKPILARKINWHCWTGK